MFVEGRVLVGETPLEPMRPRTLEVEFLADELLATALHRGLEWELFEGAKVVARAKLVEILS